MDKLKIRIIGKLPPPVGGVTISTQRLYQRLKEDGNFDVRFSVLNEHETNDTKIEKISNLFFWMVIRLISGFSEKLIHYQGANIYGLLFLGMVCKLHPKNKLIWSIHSEYLVPRIEQLRYKKLVFYVLKSVEVIVVNKNIQQQLKNNNITSKIIFHFLMPTDYYINSIKKDKPILLFNAYKIVFNAEGEDVYGLDTLLKAFSLLKESCELVLLIPILGDKEKKYLNNLLKENNLVNNKNIKLISDEKTNALDWIANSDIFVRPTITDGDALSLREALYLGVPSIASDCVDRPENTVLFINKDFVDLSQKIKYLLIQQNMMSIKKTLKANRYDAFSNFVTLYNELK
ncbi:glycosyltransferase [Pasteurella skyensis]|uniref:Glycosyltransferase n=1 Tax=Phocoenobacter skyensis TaxID=97481 RepID=A0AAJ6NA30_9PAST|nr:glycosyltransferase [Pasteurella skyensis]MDP8162126.1 glycosyltransferase [Pasteurella skyensis]MDP8170027.1 glycosyltransferase [Pasteurella skyensis]MDP8172985.1 glycosyltransferase [Pasteurella skyensis]MDP8175102.1 glycosyltransferase [Pasteurella skyensis]MDP8176752.1 glycosyltransferase [Pasteurella skyensis]